MRMLLFGVAPLLSDLDDFVDDYADVAVWGRVTTQWFRRRLRGPLCEGCSLGSRIRSPRYSGCVCRVYVPYATTSNPELGSSLVNYSGQSQQRALQSGQHLEAREGDLFSWKVCDNCPDDGYCLILVGLPSCDWWKQWHLALDIVDLVNCHILYRNL